MIDWKKIKYFKPAEFFRPDLLREETILALDSLRSFIGRPITITSSLRTLTQNMAVDGATNSAHLLQPDGLYSAVDFTISVPILDDEIRYIVISKLLLDGIERVGLYRNHFHIDTEKRKPAIWFEDKP